MINHTSVPSDPQNNMNAAEDFLLLVFHAHTIVAARSILQFMDVPTVSELADKILVNFVHLSPLPESKAGTSTPPDDGIQFYALKFSPFHLFGMVSMMQLGKGMGRELCKIGSYF